MVYKKNLKPSSWPNHTQPNLRYSVDVKLYFLERFCYTLDMGMETQKVNGGGPALVEKTTEPSAERIAVVEEVFIRFHKDLTRWCVFKLNAAKSSGRLISHNIDSDAEEIVASVYENLLTNKESIDLSRDKADIRGYLNIALKYAIDHCIRTNNYQKRKPKEGIVAYEDVLDKRPEQDISQNLKQYFGKSPKEKEQEEEMYTKIEQALLALGGKNKKMAEIIAKRYQQEQTLQEIADYYGESRSAIEQLEKKAFKKIRQFVKHGIIA